ncbi:MAG: HAMP domain-containing histidine kinase [Deinococcus sp.]|nr:HAMP domain-containing histidine kinase [Deinococcus sp.]MCL5964591.1 HAMP domain-containing histidine kinase [Deinococcus sp.]
MTLRARLLLWLLLALGLLLVPLGVITVREAERAARAGLERAVLSRLGLLRELQAEIGPRELSELVQEFGGVGFVVASGGTVRFTDQGEHRLPEGLEAALTKKQGYREIRGDTLWVALPDTLGGFGLGVPLGEVAALPLRLVKLYLTLGGLLAAIAFGVGAWGLWRSLAPLETLRRELALRGPDNLQKLSQPLLPEVQPAVTSLNRLLAELENALARLKLQEQAAKRFAYGASHELRNPLAALKGYLEVLRRDPAEARAISGAFREAERMESLLEGLLTLARLEGRGQLEGEEVDLAALVRQNYGLEAPYLPTGAHTALPQPAKVVADPALVSLALENLLKNARQHGSGVDRVALEPAGEVVWVWVYNRGGGIPEELLPRVFEPFVKQGEGTGLGLAIVAAVAAALGGQVRAENTPEGSRVGLALPSA